MDTNSIITKIKELGHANGKREELQEFCGQHFGKIIEILPRRIVNSDGADLLDCILNGIAHNPESLKNKVKVIQVVLVTMRKESTSLTHCGEIVSRLRLELPKMPPKELVKWSNDSIQSILDDSDVNMICRDILPECVTALCSYDTIKHCDTDMTSAEYKDQCVHTLCQCRWTEKQLVPLAAMFKDMQLSKPSLKQVVNRICSYIIDITPDTLPPLVHQLVKLCKQYNLEIVLAHLSHYFSVRLYSKLEPPPQDSESTTMDIDDIVPHSPAELSRALFTCIYHLSQGVVEPEVLRKYVKMWPKTQMLRAPFMIDLALAISDKGADFKSVCLDAIKCAIEQRVLDELRAKESAWVRSVIPPDVDVACVLKVITTESKQHGQLTSKGLINLAFSLLSITRSQAASICWSHGELILVRLSKARPELAGYILSQLADRLARDGSQRQYADCLYILCKLTPVSIERCPELTTILENCQPRGSWRNCAAVLQAVHPLLNFSTRTRDVLLVFCRKGLYSRESVRRCVSVCGFVSLLRHVSVCPTLSGSQRESSAHSYLTQLTVDLHATSDGAEVTSRVRNEAICMEVVSILRRCLSQDAAVKQLLYTSLYDCAKEKQALHESILELLYDHLQKFLPENSTGNLRLDNCLQINVTTATLTEPISALLYCVSQFLQAEEDDVEDILTSQAVETGSAYLRSKLTNVMEKLCDSDEFGQIDLEDPSLSDLTAESKAKCLKVQQIISCYESLIAYKIMQWNNYNTNANTVYKLYKKCNELLEKTKAPSKLSKKTKLNETKDTVKSQKSQKSQKEKGKAPAKLSSMVKDRAGPFKPLPCVWDLRFCVRIVELLYIEDIPWSSSEQRTLVVSRRDFHRWALGRVLCVLREDVDKQSITHVVHIARVLYHRVLCRLQNMIEFDDQTALSCLEVLKACLTHLFAPTCSIKMKKFLPDITGNTDSTPSSCIATLLDTIHTDLVQMETEDEDQADQVDKKTISVLSAIATLLLEVAVESSMEMCNVIVKYEEYVRTSKRECIPLIPAILTAGSREQQDATLLDELLVKLTDALGIIDEEDTSAGEESSQFPTIDDRTGHTVLLQICAHLNTRLKCTEHLLHRALDLSAAEEDTSAGEESSQFPTIDDRTGHTVLLQICAHLNTRLKCTEHLLHRALDLSAAVNMAAGPHVQRIEKELQEAYKGSVVQLCRQTGWVRRGCKLRCAVGAGSDRLLAAAVRLYGQLAALVKQIDASTAINLRLERLLKLSGKKLSAVMDNLINYVESSQKQQNASKVLRDVKLIPRVVLEAENFTKHVIILAGKAKTNWQQYMSLGTARDFRIHGDVLEEVLNNREQNDDREDEEVDINDAATELLSPLPNEDTDRSQGKKKRRRVA